MRGVRFLLDLMVLLIPHPGTVWKMAPRSTYIITWRKGGGASSSSSSSSLSTSVVVVVIVINCLLPSH